MASRSKPKRQVGREQLEEFVSGIFEEDLHAKRVASLVNGVDGVLHAASLGVRAIGQGLAAAQGLAPRHAIKQVDRLLSNPQLSMESIFSCWVRFVVGQREEIFVNFDWTSVSRTPNRRWWCWGCRPATGAAPRWYGRTSHGRPSRTAGTSMRTTC